MKAIYRYNPDDLGDVERDSFERILMEKFASWAEGDGDTLEIVAEHRLGTKCVCEIEGCEPLEPKTEEAQGFLQRLGEESWSEAAALQ